ncbi:MAG TPA: hypothetical protein VGD56_14910, partial [Gemmatirosa sp.]
IQPFVLMLTVLVVSACIGAVRDTARAAAFDTASAPLSDTVSAFAVARPATPTPADSTRRPRAIEYSDAYATRLTIHRVGSYAMLPLFAGEYWLGNRLLSSNPQPGWVKGAHVGTAAGLGALFAVNTVTGLWNLYDARHDPSDRTRRYLHSALLLAADAGFAYTGAVAGDAEHSAAGRARHKNAALVSMGVSTVGTAMMWLWRK